LERHHIHWRFEVDFAAGFEADLRGDFEIDSDWGYNPHCPQTSPRHRISDPVKQTILAKDNLRRYECMRIQSSKRVQLVLNVPSGVKKHVLCRPRRWLILIS
jgi:hypothetical protein